MAQYSVKSKDVGGNNVFLDLWQTFDILHRRLHVTIPISYSFHSFVKQKEDTEGPPEMAHPHSNRFFGLRSNSWSLRSPSLSLARSRPLDLNAVLDKFGLEDEKRRGRAGRYLKGLVKEGFVLEVGEQYRSHAPCIRPRLGRRPPPHR